MIKLFRNRINDIVLTLSEKESQDFVYDGPYYKLNLTNCQTNEEISGIDIYDLSVYYQRYNEFYVSLGTLLTELTITENTALTSNKLYFVDGDITVATGITLTIPNDTYIIQSGSGSIYNDGIITNLGNILPDSSLDTNKIFWCSYGLGTPSPIEETTYLFTATPGHYDYEVTNYAGDKVLEIGKLYVESEAVTVNTYNGTQSTYIYQG